MKTNIDTRGRIARAITGVLTLCAGVACLVYEWPAPTTWRWMLIGALVLGGLFQLFEAKKAWCVVRACGLKTPM